jgi:HNH endonuclease
MERKLREAVWRRASSRCEYCQMPQEYSDATHEIDHILAAKHAGQTVLENLALACFACNNHKGPNIAGIDPVSKSLTRLFHPREDIWSEHFAWDGALLAGVTAVGRTTVAVLDINIRHRTLHRAALIEEGVFPPS